MKTPMNQDTRIALIRHGQTAWNRAKRIQGQTNTTLTCQGWTQAQRWGRQLKPIKFDCIIASDLRRARETAEAINQSLRLPIMIDPGLREQDWGRWCGKSVRELRMYHHARLTQMERSGWHFCPPGGESRLQVTARGQSALLAAADRWPDQCLLVITHQGMIKCLCYALSNRRFLPQEPPLLKPAYLHWLGAAHQALTVGQLNALELNTP